MSQNKCEEKNFEHAWTDITPNIVYPTYPPQYPPRQEECRNCGLKRTFHSKTEEWVEYSDGVERPPKFKGTTITLSGDDITSFTNGTTTLNDH